ncbi:hypothetical protein M2139_002174 [Enterococcus sp. PF1-24]|uniref:hypothetical protein n=1 Tax=unclassified Enterococcus TaxID=2608891 RepID=UPI0024733F86|nr:MULTISPECIES: hypothetical protein [unclassified Enterococcus]MDH6365142.1 hypothetical protein [Enterococcus sp. PFB1-1]MDH6402274.1 hypothetical protein [Enterococcus sp. PF1-24]
MINQHTLKNYLVHFTHEKEILSLAFSWDSPLDEANDDRFLQKLLLTEKSENIPLLLCPDDFDFSCTILLLKIIFTETKVIWEKVGFISWKNFSDEICATTGYRDFNTWQAPDYENYSAEYAFSYATEARWQELISANWPEERRRRLLNYYYPYFNDDKNIQWLPSLNWQFHLENYQNILSKIRKNYYQQLLKKI